MEEILKKLEEQEQKIDAIYVSVEKTRKYIRNTIIVSLIVVIVPLIITLLLIPSFIGALNGNLNTFGL
jgi:Na+-driven multidrug efflux pump